MTEPTLFDIGCPLERGDVCIRKARHSPTSSANKPDKVRQVERILEILAKGNFTAKEIASEMDTELHKISGRFYQLRQSNVIYKTGKVREGASEYAKN